MKFIYRENNFFIQIYLYIQILSNEFIKSILDIHSTETNINKLIKWRNSKRIH